MIRCGTETSYHRGCRCERCAEAYRRRRRERKAGIKRSALPARYDARLLLRFFDPEITDIEIGDTLGVGRKRVMLWRRGEDNLLTTWKADALATRIGSHPCEVWGQDWWRYAADDCEIVREFID